MLTCALHFDVFVCLCGGFTLFILIIIAGSTNSQLGRSPRSRKTSQRTDSAGHSACSHGGTRTICSISRVLEGEKHHFHACLNLNRYWFITFLIYPIRLQRSPRIWPIVGLKLQPMRQLLYEKRSIQCGRSWPRLEKI